MTSASLIKLSNEFSFNLGPYHVVSQNPAILPKHIRDHVVPNFLPQLMAVWKDVETATGYRWKCTSYLRESPSHRRGHAFDLAPDIAEDSKHLYAVFNMSDPVLYKRNPLMKALQKLRNKDYSVDSVQSNHMGIFIEPDHLHLQILAVDSSNSPTSIVKWGVPKPIYQDTKQRMDLPPTNKGYLK